MAKSGSLGAILQGVSQQQARVRLLGQVSEQINMHSHVVKGLTARPGAKEVAILSAIGAGLEFDDVDIANQTYLVGYKAGELKVWDDAGSEFTVNTQDGDAVAYLGDNMSFHVYDKTIYVSNQDVVVEEDPTIDLSQVMVDQGLLQFLGANFGRNLSVVLTYSDGSVFDVRQNIPDTDPDEVNGDHIAEFFTEALDTGTTSHHGFIITGTKKATTSAIRFKNVVLVLDATWDFTITVTDGDDGSILRQHKNTAKRVEDLTQFAPHGTLVKVDGEDTADDDFYMRFDVEEEDTVGDGFGVAGTWREHVNARAATGLDFKTMPHILFKVGNDFFFERNLWQKRRVGDAESNPHPSFVGETITDIGGFQSRLTFTAGAGWVAGRTNQPADFYRKSVVADSDSDPIDIASTTESEVAIKYQIPFDRDLLLMSEKHQFIISGGTALTPKNAGMVLTTDFEMAGQARPSSTGRTILFPFTIGTHAGVKEFFSSDEIATNGADNITETISTYIDGDITQFATSTNFETTLIRTDDAASSKIVWVYKYLWEGIEKKQSSFCKWNFPFDIAYMYWDNSTVFIIMRDGDDYILTSLDMDFPDHAVGYRPMIDMFADVNADASNQVVLQYDDATFIQHTGCAVPSERVQEIDKTGSGPFTYTFLSSTVPDGATVVAGVPFVSSVTPTMPFILGRDGKPLPGVTLVVTDFDVIYDVSGGINSLFASKFRTEVQEFDNATVITADDPNDPAQIGIRSGTFVIPWGERSEWSDLTLESIGVRPFTILQIDWRGQPFMRGR